MVNMEATATGLTTDNLSFVVVHGAATDIVLTGATTNLTSGSNRVLTATLEDAAGNTVTSDDTTVIAFGKASGTGTVTGTGNATVTDGVATKAVTGALVGSVNMEATAAGLTTGTLGAFTVVHGAADQIELTGAITNLTSGATRVLTATIKDAAGNTLTSDNSTVVDFDQASGLGTVTGTGTATATAGVATKTITGALDGTVNMEATSAGLTDGTLSFVVVHGPAADIVLTGATTNLTSGATRVLTATLKDAAGNTVTSDSSTVVAFAKASGAGTVTGTGNDTAVAGVATKTITGALAGSVTMEATAAGLTTGTLGAFTVVHGAADQIELTGATTNLTSGATRVLTATVQDAAGNTVTSDNSTVVTFAKASGAGTVTGTGTDTATAGVATKTVTGVLAGAITLEATAGALTDGTLGFTIVHGAATQISLTGSTANLTSGATRVLTATIQDAAGNTVTSDNSTVVAFAKASGAGTSPALATTPPSPASPEDRHRPARRLRHHGSDLRRPDHRQPRRLHRRPRRCRRHRPHRRDHQPHLRRHPRPHRHAEGRRRQHGHLRQLDRRQLRQGIRRRHRHRHRQRHRRRRRRLEDRHRRARRLRHHGSHLGAASPPAPSAPSPSSTAPPPRSPHRRHDEPRLRRQPRAHRDGQGRRRQHRHLRQHDGRQLRPGVGHGHGHRHRQRHRRRRRHHQDRSPARSPARSRWKPPQPV